MNKIIPKLGNSKVSLMFFILVNFMFTSKNAFSNHSWKRDDMHVTYDEKEKSITFNCLIYDYTDERFKDTYLMDCNLMYSEDGNKFIHLMSANIEKQENINTHTCIKLTNKKKGENIIFLNSIEPAGPIHWSDGSTIEAKVKIIEVKYWERFISKRTRRSYMRIKWNYHHSITQIKSVHIRGTWSASDGYVQARINDVYMLNNTNSILSSNSDRLKNDTSVWNSYISNNVMVTGETDAINVTGAEPGENIKVYTASGVEVKSVVANDDKVNIKLPKNQIYLVKAGQVRYKVAL